MPYQHLFLFFLTIVLLAACSDDNSDNHKSATEIMSREIAEKAVHHIQDPMDRAREAASASEEHTRQIKKEAD